MRISGAWRRPLWFAAHEVQVGVKGQAGNGCTRSAETERSGRHRRVFKPVDQENEASLLAVTLPASGRKGLAPMSARKAQARGSEGLVPRRGIAAGWRLPWQSRSASADAPRFPDISGKNRYITGSSIWRCNATGKPSPTYQGRLSIANHSIAPSNPAAKPREGWAHP